jgi:hypothetical protein
VVVDAEGRRKRTRPLSGVKGKSARSKKDLTGPALLEMSGNPDLPGVDRIAGHRVAGDYRNFGIRPWLASGRVRRSAHGPDQRVDSAISQGLPPRTLSKRRDDIRTHSFFRHATRLRLGHWREPDLPAE